MTPSAEMRFVDCNARYGVPAQRTPLRPVPTVEALRMAMSRAGVAGAVVRREEVYWAGVSLGNELLARDIAPYDGLYGLWAILPPHTHEVPAPDEMPALMKAHKIVGWLCHPATHRYSFREFAMGAWFTLAEERRIPIFIGQDGGVSLDELAQVLEHHPNLRVVWLGQGVWPDDRLIRPLLASFSGFYLELSRYIAAGGVEELVAEYGAKRLLYGSGFPDMYFGGGMLMIHHAEIGEAERKLIAADNLRRLIAEVRYD